MAHLVPLSFVEDDYAVWLCIFAAIVIPMSMLNLSEQASVQVLLSACRILMIVLLVGTPLLAALSHEKGHDEPHFDHQLEPHGAPLLNLSKFQVIVEDFGEIHIVFRIQNVQNNDILLCGRGGGNPISLLEPFESILVVLFYTIVLTTIRDWQKAQWQIWACSQERNK